MFKSLLYLAVTAVTVFQVNTCKRNCDNSVGFSPCTVDFDRKIRLGNAAFSGRFLKEAMKLNPRRSLVMSPVGALIPLAQLALYGEGNTLAELLDAMHLPNKTSIKCTIPKITKRLKIDKYITVASKILASNDHQLSSKFKQDTLNVFIGTSENVDYKSKYLPDDINEWIKDVTNNQITKIATRDMFVTAGLVLVDGIHFLAKWERKFDKAYTQNFYFDKGRKQANWMPFMYKEDNFKYGEDPELDCKMLEIGFEGNHTFLVMLPNKINGLSELVDKLVDQSVFYNAYSKIKTQKIKVQLPKIQVKWEFDLKPILQSMDIKTIFDKHEANFSGIDISHRFTPLQVSYAKQKIFIEINENGSEARTNTVADPVKKNITYNLNSNSTEFRAHRPFAFYILFKGNIIINGIFRGECKKGCRHKKIKSNV